MSSSVDEKTMARALALPDLTEMEVTDTFYYLRKLNPLLLMVTEMHAPRKYCVNYEESKGPYRKSLIYRQQTAWKDLILEVAHNLVFVETERKLNTLKSSCLVKKIILPYNLFSWSIKDSINRLELSNDLYVDLVELKYESNILDEIKLQMDLMQILEIYNQIVSDFMNDIDLLNELIPTLKEYAKRDEYQKELSIQFEFTSNKYQQLLERYNRNLLIPPAKLKEELLPKQVLLQISDMESEALIPIHDRYKVNWFRTNASFKKLKNSKSLQKIRDKISELYSIRNAEKECFDSKLSIYRTQFTNFMDRYDSLTDLYDIEYEDADNAVAIIRSNINKAKEDLQFYKDQVQFFQKSLKETRDAIQREELEEQLKLEIKNEASNKKRKSKPKKNKK